MKNIISFFSDWFHFTKEQFSLINVADVFDILILTALFYLVYRFMRDRRAARFAYGIVALFLIYGISVFCGLHAIAYIANLILQVGILILVVLFQPEIRSALENIGEKKLGRFKFTTKKEKTGMETIAMIEAICAATSDLQRERQGALIVIERTTKLGDIARSGIEIDSQVNAYILRNIFYPKAPLHDGAVVIRENRICAAGCFLPLTQDTDISRQMGTRHRAAIGMSETSDAIVIVVSEETGRISIAYNSKMKHDYNYQTMYAELVHILLPGEEIAGRPVQIDHGRER